MTFKPKVGRKKNVRIKVETNDIEKLISSRENQQC